MKDIIKKPNVARFLFGASMKLSLSIEYFPINTRYDWIIASSGRNPRCSSKNVAFYSVSMLEPMTKKKLAKAKTMIPLK